MTIDATVAPSSRAAFHAMTESTREDWAIIAEADRQHRLTLPDRVLAELRGLEHASSGFPVDRLEHSVQTATRAYRANRDDEYVLCALIHDVGDLLGSFNHSALAAAVLEPFVSPENHWMVAHHGIFQAYYYFHHLDLDRNIRDEYRDHPWYDRTAEFCADFDQPAFDPGYDSLPLEHFEPLVHALMSKPKQSIYIAAKQE